ncbi:GNAT family N-acetyltransferase [Ornithinibacillus sp. L9]|uniref:GNAT family N-acetyltransferase n=1 Tax=Ornithinibacillus caprae TaxID=2678566 RepID=A0A6N8FFL5_9BACI|nr:GNAT family N-acetyltransferase [Ornithinibacillus caprae]MUK88303.1 GNAT family N-acetyltransferase [Ornithinibacillus caprae]
MEIRQAEMSDARGIAKVHVDSWKTTYNGIVPDEYLQQLSYDQREQLWINNMSQHNVFVAVNETGRIVGFSAGGKERSGNYPTYTGELYAIYILQEYQRKGLGKLLLHSVVEDLKQQGINRMVVLVLEENSSQFFYQSLGARKLDTLEVSIAGKKLNELVYGWDDLSSLL